MPHTFRCKCNSLSTFHFSTFNSGQPEGKKSITNSFFTNCDQKVNTNIYISPSCEWNRGEKFVEVVHLLYKYVGLEMSFTAYIANSVPKSALTKSPTKMNHVRNRPKARQSLVLSFNAILCDGKKKWHCFHVLFVCSAGVRTVLKWK